MLQWKCLEFKKISFVEFYTEVFSFLKCFSVSKELYTHASKDYLEGVQGKNRSSPDQDHSVVPWIQDTGFIFHPYIFFFFSNQESKLLLKS